MKFSKTTIREAVKKLIEGGMDGTDGSNKEVLRLNVSTEYTRFVKFCEENKPTDEEVAKALEPVKHSVNLYNDQMRHERLDQLDGMKYKDAVAEYLRTQCVAGFRVINDKDMGWIIADDPAVELDAYDFVSTLCKTELNGLVDSVCIFADNLARFTIKQDEGAYVSKKSMSAGYIALRDRKGWNIPLDQLSKGKLADQLNEICQMMTAGVAKKMQSTDVTYVDRSVIVAKSKPDSAGAFQIRDERTIIRHVFRAIYTRYHGLPYEWQNDTRGVDKAPLTSEPNKDAAESGLTAEFTPAKVSAAGPAVIVAEPKKGSTKKGSTKKSTEKKDGNK